MWNFRRWRTEEFSSFWLGERLSPTASVCMNSFRAHGFSFNLYIYDPVDDVPSFVKKRDAEKIFPAKELFLGCGGAVGAKAGEPRRTASYTARGYYADLFRLHLLRKVGGWWVDTDVVCNTGSLPHTEIAFAEEDSLGTINNGLMKFPRNHPVIVDVLKDIVDIGVDSPWGTVGPKALTKALGRYPMAEHKWKTSDMHPLHWAESVKFLLPEFSQEVSQRTANSRFIHLYTSMFSRFLVFDAREYLPLKGSYLDMLYGKYGEPSAISRLRPIDERELREALRRYMNLEAVKEALVKEALDFSLLR